MEVLFSFDFQGRFMRPLSLVAKCLAIKLVARMNGYLLSSETAAKGMDLGRSAGKEDPVELDSSLLLWRSIFGVE